MVLGIFGLKPAHGAFPSTRGGGERALAVDGVIAQAPTMVGTSGNFTNGTGAAPCSRPRRQRVHSNQGAYGQGRGCPIAPCVPPLGSARSGSARRGTSCARGRITTTVG